MAIDTSGLLTGLLTPSQRSQQRMNNNANMAQTGLMSQVLNLANTFTDATSNLIGADTRSPEQIAGQQVAELLQAGDIDGAINILKDVDPAAAMTLIARQKAEQERLSQQEAQQAFLNTSFPQQPELSTGITAGMSPEAMINLGSTRQANRIAREQNQARLAAAAAQAERFGMTEIAEQAALPGADADVLLNEIRVEALRRDVGSRGRPAKINIARQAGVDPETLAAISNGDYDSMEFDTFLDTVEGAEADTKAFIRPGEGVGIWRVNKQGRVWDAMSNRWVNPNALQLQPAPVRTETLDVSSAFRSGVIGLAVEDFGESFDEAKQSVSTLANGEAAYGLLDAGVRTGSLSQIRNDITRFGITIGMIDPSDDQAQLEANTDAFLKTRAAEVGRKIQLFGSGTGLSDKDREYAEGMAAGSTELTEESIRRLLAMEKIANTEIILNFNKGLDENVAAGNMTAEDARLFRLEEPRQMATEAVNVMIDGQPQSVEIIEVRPNRWVTRSGIPVEDLEEIR